MSLSWQKNVISREGNYIKCIISALERVQECCVIIKGRAYTIHFYLIASTLALFGRSDVEIKARIRTSL